MLILCFIASVCALASSLPAHYDINDDECGDNLVGYKYPDHYIVGGEEAHPHAYPWMAALIWRGSFVCGGTLIKGRNSSSYYILTAAHCTEGSQARQWQVQLGRHNLSKPETESAQQIDVDEIHEHPGYDDYYLSWDVALLKLSTPPTRSQYVHPGCIAVDDKTPNEMGTVIGWGTLSDGGDDYPDELQVVQKPILSHAVCRSQLGSNDYQEDNMICAGYNHGGADSCQGDSGGPFMTRRDGSGRSRYEITGVVSWGFGCAQANSPGVYHNVYMSKSWINGIIN